MIRFRLEYGGVISEFNGNMVGNSYRKENGKTKVAGYEYSVRPSKANLWNVSRLWECFNADGTTTYHFSTRGSKKVTRGLEVKCKRIGYV